MASRALEHGRPKSGPSAVVGHDGCWNATSEPDVVPPAIETRPTRTPTAADERIDASDRDPRSGGATRRV